VNRKGVYTMEKAKLIVEYFRVLMWPIVVIFALLAFSTDIRKLMGRVQSVTIGSVSVGTDPGKRENTQGNSAPDIWFNTLQTQLSQQACMQQAEAALNVTKFKEGGFGLLSYGYSEKFVGAIWCGRDNEVFITVAGPHEGLQNKHKLLQDAFLAAAAK
jgi:hypothetical protein